MALIYAKKKTNRSPHNSNHVQKSLKINPDPLIRVIVMK